ncbi:hypothetical protein FACS1894218_2090 [Bacilli bacterium]|nr:hypothetical protein FACS1894218_2090 [Bacilli bacterium]
MPENNKNLCDGRSADIVNTLGHYVYDTPLPDYMTFFIKHGDGANATYTFDNTACVDDVEIKDPAGLFDIHVDAVLAGLFISFLNQQYEDKKLSDNDYQINYNKVPLRSTD